MSSYNPEKRAWKGRSYKKGGARVTDLRNTLDRALVCPICKPGPCVGHKVEPPEPDPIAPESLAQMRARGGTWAVYKNVTFDSADFGHLQFLKYGPGCTFERPPETCPDTPHGLGWKYQHVGYVDLALGKIVKEEPS
jgi:hypothetical protein